MNMVLAREMHAIRTKTIVNITGWLKFHAIYANLYVKLFFCCLALNSETKTGFCKLFCRILQKEFFIFRHAVTTELIDLVIYCEFFFRAFFFVPLTSNFDFKFTVNSVINFYLFELKVGLLQF